MHMCITHTHTHLIRHYIPDAIASKHKESVLGLQVHPHNIRLRSDDLQGRKQPKIGAP